MPLFSTNGTNLIFLIHEHTSLRRIVFPKTTTDSERTRPRIKKVIIWLKSPINPLMIPQKFQSTNVAFVEISIHFDCHGIIEYQICWSIFPIVQANLRQKQPKLIVTKLF